MRDYVTIRVIYDESRGERIEWEIPVARVLVAERTPIVRAARATRDGPSQNLVLPPTTRWKRLIGQAVQAAKRAGYQVQVS